MSELPKKIWIEKDGDEHFVYLTDELVWTGYLTEYVRADYHHRLREALEKMMRQAYAANGHYPSDDNETFAANEIEIEQARALLAELDNLEPKP